jgi:hypothetical protein
MKTMVNVARYHMTDRLNYLVLPWAVMTFSFLVNLVIAAAVPNPQGNYTGGLASFYVFLLICGALSMTRSLPFGLMLGVSRRVYYLGTALLMVALGVAYGLGLTVVQAIERASGGWGLSLHFFRIPWLMDGPWYQTWLTSFVLLVLLFLYGMWCGLVYRRWSVPGLLSFIAAQVLVALAAVVAVSLTNNWHAVGNFFTALTAPALTGALAALALAMGLGGLSTIRRVTT